MSSRIRNTLNAGACALMIGAAAVTLAPISSSAFDGGFGGFGGGFGRMGGGFEKGGRGGRDLGKADRGTHTPREPQTTLKVGSDKASSDRTSSDKDHVGDTWGWVVGDGLRLNFPTIAEGDFLQAELNYTEGAPRYLFDVETTNWEAAAANTATYGILSDCVFGSTGANPVADATGCNVSIEHYWTPAVHQTAAGAYAALTYNTQENALDSMLSTPIVPLPPLTFNDVALGWDILTAPIGSLPPLTFNGVAAAGISADEQPTLPGVETSTTPSNLRPTEQVQ